MGSGVAAKAELAGEIHDVPTMYVTRRSRRKVTYDRCHSGKQWLNYD